MNRARKIAVRTIDANVNPCPFCGGKATVRFGTMYHFVCESCGADVMFFGAENNMIAGAKKWNRRANEKA